MNHLKENLPEIRCPYCFSYISITSNKKDNSKLILFCENCGQKEIELDEYNSIIQNSTIKSCNHCCKNIPIKELFYSSKYNNFICKKCYSEFMNNHSLNDSEYIYFPEIGKRCKIHKNLQNLFFCQKCEKHICAECMIKHPNSHKVIKISNEAIKKNNIDELKFIIQKEEKDIENELNFGKNLINSLMKSFDDNIKNRKNVLNLKKLLYQYFITNSNSYNTYKNIDMLFSKEINPDLFINDAEVKDLEELLNNIEINPKENPNKDNKLNDINNNKDKNINNNKDNNINNNKDKNINNNSNKIINNNKDNNINNNKKIITNSKNKYDIGHLSSIEKDRRRSKSIIKQSKMKTQIYPQSSIQDLNKSIDIPMNKGGNNKKSSKPMFSTCKTCKTPTKLQKYKDRQNIQKSNDMINNEIKNNNFKFVCYNVPEEKKKENLINILRLKNSIISMIDLGLNKILISIFSPDKNLILAEIIKQKNNEKYIISMKILSYVSIGEKPIIHMDICDNGIILACSDEYAYIIKILNNKINIQNTIPNDDNNNNKANNENNLRILSSISFGKNYIVVIKCNENYNKKNINDIKLYSYENNTITQIQSKNKAEISNEFIILSVKKINNNTCAIIEKPINCNKKNVVYLGILNLVKNQLYYYNRKEFIFTEKNNNIFVEKLLNNYILLTDSVKYFFIYDFQNKNVVAKFMCDKVLSMKIKDFTTNQKFFYTIERKEADEKDVIMKKYCIQKNNDGIKIGINNNNPKIFHINLMNNAELNGYNKNNTINNMLVISDNERDEKDKNGTENNLVLLTDNAGNIYYKYY